MPTFLMDWVTGVADPLRRNYQKLQFKKFPSFLRATKNLRFNIL